MPKTVSASEVKNKLGSVVNWVLRNQDEVIVESRGEPTVVIMPYTEYERIRQLRDQDRRAQALERLRKLRAETLARNQDLSPEEGDALADRFVRDVIDDMAQEGKIHFEK